MAQIIADILSEAMVLRRQKNIVFVVLRKGKFCHPEIYNQENYYSRMKAK